MTRKMICLFSFVALLSFVELGLPVNPADLETYPVKLSIINELTNDKASFTSSVTEGGVLFGVLNNLNGTNGFSYSYSVHKTLGLYLESVNGVAGSVNDHTYWELLTERKGRLTPLETGIGCYQPKKDEHIILRFTKWD
ncbi:transcobalamin beta a [Misgurnus anguillicaudatus]|uniref:transcobalamin beta a n=1 Tax=Misgurnus anguillicaudatus TaxID=75329 RepID=UPI003CCFD88C